MMLFEVALQVLREAVRRRWVLALFIGITGMLLLLSFTLQLEVVDGALAASRLFGKVLGIGAEDAEVALRPLFAAGSALLFYGGLLFGIVATADFAPRLLEPGRIEHLLALPIRRWQLLLGTFLGVLVLCLSAGLYGALCFTVLIGTKTGFWMWQLFGSALLCTVAFASIYAVMLGSVTWVRSAATSAALGGVMFILRIIASNRVAIAPFITEGWGRTGFEAVTSVVPRIASLGLLAAHPDLDPERLAQLPTLLVGMGLFTVAVLTLALSNFESKDY